MLTLVLEPDHLYFVLGRAAAAAWFPRGGLLEHASMNMRIVFALVVCTGVTLSAQDARQIVAEVQSRSSAASQVYEGMLQVIEEGGRTSEKQWTYRRLGSHGKSKSVIRFTSPAEVRGVALLIVNFPDRASDQWMWTPAINRERRIASQDRRTRFFGTDFSFEDLEERDVDHYDYVLRGEESVDGEPCWRIDSTPKAGKRSQYTRSVLWIRKSNYTYAQIENYNGNTAIRRLSYRDVANVEGIWTARTLEMQDFTRKSRTILKLESLKYNTPLKDDQFTLQALQRG
jgi:outer membrane lipoprotein-sorting protein